MPPCIVNGPFEKEDLMPKNRDHFVSLASLFATLGKTSKYSSTYQNQNSHNHSRKCYLKKKAKIPT